MARTLHRLRRHWGDLWLDHPALGWLLGSAGAALALTKLAPTPFYALAPAVASIAGVLLGMTSVVFTLYQQSSSPGVAQAKVRYRSALQANWKAVHVGFIWACGLALGGLMTYEWKRPVALGLLGWGTALMLERSARLVRLLSLYLTIDRFEARPRLEIREDLAEH